jgi:2-polyprenyl-6-methoxyphenol hydroxylase-like FAD-dependent oxidoreductase
MKVLIAGAGIAGPATAIALRKAGIHLLLTKWSLRAHRSDSATCRW